MDYIEAYLCQEGKVTIEEGAPSPTTWLPPIKWKLIEIDHMKIVADPDWPFKSQEGEKKLNAWLASVGGVRVFNAMGTNLLIRIPFKREEESVLASIAGLHVAAGADLDDLAGQFAQRRDGETDDDYRQRIETVRMALEAGMIAAPETSRERRERERDNLRKAAPWGKGR